MINFSDIKEDIISVRFDTRQELEYLVDNLRKLGYVYGTGKMDNDVRNVLDDYGKLESSYLTLDRTRDYIESNWVSVGKHRNAISYDFKDIEWGKEFKATKTIELTETEYTYLLDVVEFAIMKTEEMRDGAYDDDFAAECQEQINIYEGIERKLKEVIV